MLNGAVRPTQPASFRSSSMNQNPSLTPPTSWSLGTKVPKLGWGRLGPLLPALAHTAQAPGRLAGYALHPPTYPRGSPRCGGQGPGDQCGSRRSESARRKGQGQSCWDWGSQLVSASGARVCVLRSFNSPSLRTYHPCLQEMANKQVILTQGDENSETRGTVNLEMRSGRASWWR